MADITADAQAEVATSDQKRTREQSTIGFPYTDLEDAVSVASALLSCGGVPCDPDQLAAALNHTPSSGTFRMKIATARMFGLIETNQNKYQLTDLGFGITDATRQKAARADAFLKVPLTGRVFRARRTGSTSQASCGLSESSQRREYV